MRSGAQTLAAATCRLLTPGGVGAIAVVRVEGEAAWELVRGCVCTRTGELPREARLDHAYYGNFRDDSETIDDVIVAARPVAHSSSPSVEICCHGGRRVVERILLTLQSAGATIAPHAVIPNLETPWTVCIQRLADTCLARTTTRRGALYLLGQRNLLPDRLAEIVNCADAGDHDTARCTLRELVDASAAAHRFHTPADVAIVGAPNAGKSSLVNRLAGRESAIVTNVPGTTRDWVTAPAAIEGVPITLIDTAGGHDAECELERQAIDAGVRRAADADLVIAVIDGSAGTIAWPPASTSAMSRADMVVINKADLEISQAARRVIESAECPVVKASARTGAGVEAVRGAILGCLGVGKREVYDRTPAIFESCLRERIAGLVERLDAGAVLRSADIVASIRG